MQQPSEKKILNLLKNSLIGIENQEYLEYLIEYCIRIEDENVFHLLPSIFNHKNLFPERPKLLLDLAYRSKSEFVLLGVKTICGRLRKIVDLIIDGTWESNVDWVTYMMDAGHFWTDDEVIVYVQYVMDRVSYEHKKVVLNYPEFIVRYPHRLLDFEEEWLYLYDKYICSEAGENRVKTEVPELILNEILDTLYEPGVGEVWKRQNKKMEEYGDLICNQPHV